MVQWRYEEEVRRYGWTEAGDVDRREILKRIGKLNVWKAHGQRAPHKPLLLLLALARLQRGEERLALFEEIRGPLTDLLRLFGPARSAHHPEHPFGRLCNDGLWEIPEAETLSRTSSGDLHTGALLGARARGGFPEHVHRTLRGDPALVTQAAQLLLQGHFPESLHDDIRAFVKLRADWVLRDADPGTRDPRFRSAVLRAYEHRCAVCNYDIRLGDDLLGLEAAHVKWHAYGGPDEVTNGLALCGFHHKAFDRGAWGLRPLASGFRIVVSSEAHGQSQALGWLRDYHGERLRQPLRAPEGPLVDYVQWHRDQVFRAPAL